MAGLRDDIKGVVVLQQNIASIEDIIRWGRTSERIPKAKTAAEIAIEVAKILKADEMSKSLDQKSLFMRPIDNVQTTRGRSTSPHVKFREETPSFHPSFQPQDYGSARTTYPQDSSHEAGRDGRDGCRDQYPREDYYRRRRGQAQRYNTRPGATSNNQSNNYNSDFVCGNCSLNHKRGECPAWGKECHSCHKLGHFSRNCRGRRQYDNARSQPDYDRGGSQQGGWQGS